MKRFRLTPMQEAMLFEALDSPTRYVSVLRYEIFKDIDEHTLRRRANLLTQRHEMLRTFFVRDDDDVIRQQVADHAEVDFSVAETCNEDSPKISPLHDKLFKLVLCGNELIVIFSHIILDGWSIGVLMRELLADDEPSEKASPFRYYIKWLESRNYEEDLSWWKNYLGNAEAEAKMPGSLNGTGYERRSLFFCLPEPELLRRRAAGLRVTAGRLLQAVWCMLIARYNGGSAVVGTVAAGRSAPVPGITGIVGMCVNTLPVAAKLPKPPHSVTFADWLKSFAAETAEAEKRGYCRLSDIMKVPMPHILAIDVPFNSKDYKLKKTSAELVTDFDTVFILDDEISVEFAYNSHAYADETVSAIKGHFLTALEAVLKYPDMPLEQIPILAEDEIRELTAIKEDAEILGIIESKTIVDFWSESVLKNTSRVSLVCGDISLTYAELADLASKLAFALKAKGVGAEMPVALELNRSERYVIAELAVLLAGGYFIPLDPEWPDERISTILTETKPFMVIDEQAYDELMDSRFALTQLTNPLPQDAAYMIMTSGTTGIPKGVVVTHRNIANFCLWAGKRYDWQAGDACAMVLGFGFDGSMWDIWLPLINGGTLHVLADDVRFRISALGEYCKSSRITHIDLPVTMAESFLEIYNDTNKLADLRVVIVGGEEVRRAIRTPYAVSNEYGPTECTVCCSTGPVRAGDFPVPVGAPPPNMHAYILDEWARLCPDGVIGEACFAGVQVSRGYYNSPDLTGSRFINNPFADGNENYNILYRTGDLMKWQRHGRNRELVFCGRADNQVKINGFRVELGEIENALRSNPMVNAVVAAVKENPAGEKIICAYIVPNGEAYIPALNAALAAKLPAFMRPVTVIVNKIPLSSGGKVDYALLPPPKAENTTEYVEPATQNERILINAVSRVLNTVNAGTAHNYLELGGNSISAMRIAFYLEREGFELTAGEIIASKSFAELAAKMRVKALIPVQIYAKDIFTPLNAQQAMVFLAETSGSASYTVTLKLNANGLSAADLRRRLDNAAKLHDILRTTFEYDENGNIIGRVNDTHNIPVYVDEPNLTGGIHPLRDPLLDLTLCGGELTVRYHHIALDGWSVDLLINELLREKFPENAPSFAEFANRIYRENHNIDGEWWRKNCEHAKAVPLFSAKGAEKSKYKRIAFCPPELLAKCAEAARKAKVTTAAFTLAAWGVTLTALTDADGDILIPFVVSSRDDDNLMGMCAAAYPLRFVRFGETFGELARGVLDFTLQCTRHLSVPQEITATLPKYLFVFEESSNGITANGEQNYDLIIKFASGGELIYNASHVTEKRAGIIAARLEAALKSAVDDKISAFREGEYELAAKTFAHGRKLHVKHRTAAEAFTAAAELYAEHTALEFDGESLTYSGLYRRAKQLASELNGLGIGAGNVVAINLPRNIDAIIAHIGVVLSKAAFLPIDPAWPVKRTHDILRDSGAMAVINDGLTVELTDFGGKVPEDTAYLIYTSGTTGKPKGAVLTQRALANQTAWAVDEFGFHAADKVLHYISFTFDPSVWTIFVTLSSGAALSLMPECLRLNPDAISGYIEKNRVTVCVFPAAVGIDIMRRLKKSDLRLAFIGGDTIKNLPPRTGKLEIINSYGPTETCVNATFYRIPPDVTATRNIGIPVANTSCYVLDAKGDFCAIGVSGELCIGGVQLANGYLNRPKETASAFVEHPKLKTIYKTGDRVCWNEDGTLEFSGRVDRQVKIRGNRVELGEIEHALCEQPEIVDAKVRLNGESLNAYVIFEKTAIPLDISALRQKLGERLPPYMLPNTVTALEVFPLTRHGKIDFAALPDAKSDVTADSGEYLSKTERAIADAWKSVLRLDPDFQIRRGASFFDLGGHSLMLFQVVGLLAVSGIDVSIKSMIENPVLMDLANAVDGGRHEATIKTAAESTKLTENYDCYVREMEQIPLNEKRELKSVLITGGTGFLGCHLIWELYKNTRAVIYLPVRGDESRIADALEYYYGPRGKEIASSRRLRVFSADISENPPHCDAKLDIILHTAADVRHYAPDEELYAANITATGNMLKLAARHNGVLFAHISTTGAANASVIYENDRGLGAEFDHMYQRSKQIAERRVLDAGKRGIKYAIFRVGNLTPALETGVPALTTGINSFLRLTKAMLTTGLRSEPDSNVGYTFVDEVSLAIRLLSEPISLENKVFHLSNPNTITFAELFSLAGIEGKALPKNALLAELREMMKSQDKAISQAARDYFGRISQISIEKSNSSDVIEGNLQMDATLLTLKRLGFEWPQIPAAYAKSYNSIV